MSEIVLGKSGKIKVQDLDGKIHEVRRPNVSEVREYESKEKEASDKLDFVFSFLDKLGLPKSVIDTCTVDEINSIVDGLINKKKP